MLLSLLLDRLDRPLRAMRTLHDVIFAVQVRGYWFGVQGV